jgi:hypothetical protein
MALWLCPACPCPACPCPCPALPCLARLALLACTPQCLSGVCFRDPARVPHVIRSRLRQAKDAARAAYAAFWIRETFAGLEATLAECAGTYCVGDSVTLADAYLVPQVGGASGAGRGLCQTWECLTVASAWCATCAPTCVCRGRGGLRVRRACARCKPLCC